MFSSNNHWNFSKYFWQCVHVIITETLVQFSDSTIYHMWQQWSILGTLQHVITNFNLWHFLTVYSMWLQWTMCGVFWQCTTCDYSGQFVRVLWQCTTCDYNGRFVAFSDSVQHVIIVDNVWSFLTVYSMWLQWTMCKSVLTVYNMWLQWTICWAGAALFVQQYW